MDKPTSLYRHYNDKGILLYVGIADDHHIRFQSHLKFSEWKDRISSVKIEKYPTRKAAADAEIVAIKSEHPLYNRHHQTKGSIGDVLRQVLKAIDYQELEDSIDDYNKTRCATYQADAYEEIVSLCKCLKIDFSASVEPQLTASAITDCPPDCNCLELEGEDYD